MKATPFAAILALAFAGSACSQAAETPAEAPEAAVVSAETETAPSGTFNLGLPDDLETASSGTTGTFNLGLESTAPATSVDGFNLVNEVASPTGLEALPEIEDTLLTDGDGETVEDVVEELIDEEPVIRLE